MGVSAASQLLCALHGVENQRARSQDFFYSPQRIKNSEQTLVVYSQLRAHAALTAMLVCLHLHLGNDRRSWVVAHDAVVDEEWDDSDEGALMTFTGTEAQSRHNTERSLLALIVSIH